MNSTINKEQVVNEQNEQLDELLETAPIEQIEIYRRDFETYKQLFYKFLHTAPTVVWNEIEAPPEGTVKEYDNLEAPEYTNIHNSLDKLVVVKLNGGLGTSMGCKGTKSLIAVRDGLTFLDFSVIQIEHLNKTYGVDVPLLLMNSFNTESETSKTLKKYRNTGVTIETFVQSRCPRINKETLLPIATDLSQDENEAWYPPGHGDFLKSIYNCGLLEKFIEEGKEFFFVSNIDNTGATVDLKILNFLINSTQKVDYLMEVTDKTAADVKGGTVIKYKNRLMHLEMPQVPKANIEDFKGVNRFNIFNTNNIWLRISEIKPIVETNKQTEVEVIVNPKVTSQGVEVLQLENSIGGAIKLFKNAYCMNVERGRFLPVKKTQDLLLIMSNYYQIQNGRLVANEARTFPTIPLIKLGSQFEKVQDCLRRFSGIPDMLSLNHLTVAGDVWFGKSIKLKGTVIVIADYGQRIDIPDEACLENRIITGNLRMIDH